MVIHHNFAIGNKNSLNTDHIVVGYVYFSKFYFLYFTVILVYVMLCLFLFSSMLFVIFLL